MISNLVVNLIYKLTPNVESFKIFDAFVVTKIPNAEFGPLERIQIAVLINSNDNYKTFKNELFNASQDWRDILISAKLENEDWKEILHNKKIIIKNDFKAYDVSNIKKYELELNESISIFLNGEKNNTGYNPINGEKRIKDKYKKESDRILNQLLLFLHMIDFFEPDWSKKDLTILEKRIMETFNNKYLFLDDVVKRQIVNYELYSWK